MSDCIQRLDAARDTYPGENLKVLTQQKCGNGARIKVGHEWNTAFLKNEDNKKELFAFISKELSAAKMIGRPLLSTHHETVLSNKDIDLSSLEPCNHSEADTRIILHLPHAAEQGHTYFHSLGLSELWVGFGCGKYYHDIPVHAICATKSQALPLFHSFLGVERRQSVSVCQTSLTHWLNSLSILTASL